MSSIGGMVHLSSTQVINQDDYCRYEILTHAGVNRKYSWAPFSSLFGWDLTPLTELEAKSRCTGETGLQKELVAERTYGSFLSPARLIPARLSLLLNRVSSTL